MSIESVRSRTMRSNEILELARRYAEQADALPADDPKRVWLEEEAQRLIAEARELTDEASELVTKYK